MILSAGLSPAWQQILRFETFRPGEVNRTVEAVWCASGKVINVAIAVAALERDITIISPAGGVSGEIIQQEIDALKIRSEWIPTASATRVCTTLLDNSGPATELVEPAANLEAEAIEDFFGRTQIHANVAGVTVLTGSIPANAPADLYARILRNTHKRFILDLRGEPLQHCLPLYPFLIKPNREELQATLGISLATDAELLRAMRGLNDWGVRWVVVSDGPHGVWVTSDEIAVRLIPPAVHVVNSIGSGDALAAGIACGLEHHDDVLAAVKLGMGAAANNVEQLLPARLNPQRTRELAAQVEVQEL